MLDKILAGLFSRPQPSPSAAKPLGYAVYVHSLDWVYGIYRHQAEARAVRGVIDLPCSVVPVAASKGDFTQVGWAVINPQGKVYDTYPSRELAQAVAEATPGMAARALFIAAEEANA